jgi:microcystin-dependent protein
MSEAVLGEIRLFSGSYAPEGWLICNGQLLQIQQYQALYALIGTTYGGNAVNNFGLPDLRGRVPVCQGQGPNLSNRSIGQKGGASLVTLTEATIPPHGHDFIVSGTEGSTNAVSAAKAGGRHHLCLCPSIRGHGPDPCAGFDQPVRSGRGISCESHALSGAELHYFGRWYLPGPSLRRFDHG